MSEHEFTELGREYLHVHTTPEGEKLYAPASGPGSKGDPVHHVWVTMNDPRPHPSCLSGMEPNQPPGIVLDAEWTYVPPPSIQPGPPRYSPYYMHTPRQLIGDVPGFMEWLDARLLACLDLEKENHPNEQPNPQNSGPQYPRPVAATLRPGPDSLGSLVGWPWLASVSVTEDYPRSKAEGFRQEAAAQEQVRGKCRTLALVELIGTGFRLLRFRFALTKLSLGRFCDLDGLHFGFDPKVVEAVRGANTEYNRRVNERHWWFQGGYPWNYSLMGETLKPSEPWNPPTGKKR